MELNLPSKLLKALEKEASDAGISPHAHILKKLERVTPLIAFIDSKKVANGLPFLIELLKRIPAVQIVSHELTPSAYWWVKFSVDVQHPLAWRVVQALAFIFNEISISERLPTIFKPTSPPPYLNGGPDECLFWVIESTFNYIDPKWIASVAEERLPHPIEKMESWSDQISNDEEESIPDYPYRPSIPPPLPGIEPSRLPKPPPLP